MAALHRREAIDRRLQGKTRRGPADPADRNRVSWFETIALADQSENGELTCGPTFLGRSVRSHAGSSTGVPVATIREGALWGQSVLDASI
jgi:hypothetical protein